MFLRRLFFIFVALLSVDTAAFGFSKTFRIRDQTGCQSVTFNWNSAPVHLRKKTHRRINCALGRVINQRAPKPLEVLRPKPEPAKSP